MKKTDLNKALFSCQSCGSCCRQDGYVWLAGQDIKNAAAELGISVKKFKHDFTDYKFLRGRVLVKDDDNCCFILNDNTCKIYEARPKQCRQFPFWKHVLADVEEWDYLATFCKGVTPINGKQ